MDVTVYSTPSCVFCHKVKDYFKAKGVRFKDFDVSRDQKKAEEMVRKSGQMGVPVVVIKGKVIVGFDKPKIDDLLNLN